MTLSPYFLLLPVFLPLAGGAAILPLNFREDRKRSIYIEVITCLTSLCMWAALLWADRTPVVLYSFIGGFSVSFCLDGLGALFAGMISVMWPLVSLYAFEYMEHGERKNSFFAFYTMTFGVTLGVALSANMVTMYVFFEMLTLVTIPLVTHYGDHESMYAGRKYAAYTIGGAGLAFFAVVMTTVYGNAGSFVYGGSLSGGYSESLMKIAFLLAFVGFGAKAAVFPLHDWLPTASVAPTPVTALLHAVAVVNSGVFAVMRTTWYVFGTDFLEGGRLQSFCVLLAAFSLLFGAVMALKERHFKRRLAFSTMSNLSYMLFGVMLMTPEGFAGGMAHMLFHGVIKMSLFLCAGAFMEKTGYSYIYEIPGVGRKMPVTFVCYTLGALSLSGIPLFCGFVSKWTLLTAGIHLGTSWAVAGVCALFVSAFLCAMYTLTVSIRAFFPFEGSNLYAGEDAPGAKVHEAGWRMLTPVLVFTAVNILFGVFSGPIMKYLEQVAAGLL